MANDTVLPKKVAIYIRVSTQFQIDKDSLQVQRRELIGYSELVLNIKDYEIFEDPGYSAKNTDRPAYQQMITRLRTGEFSHLLVWKIDRISRNLLDFAQMYAEMKQLGVTFVSKNEQFDTSTAIGEAMLKIILVFAELERQMTAERVTAVMMSRANNGQWNGGKVPLGYDWNKDSQEFTVNEDEAKIYRYACDLYRSKQSLLAVARALNSKGLKTKAGKAWSPTSLWLMLTNEFYLGTYRYNVHSDRKGTAKNDESKWITIENHHPPLIDRDDYAKLCYILKKNRRKGRKRGDSFMSKNYHIFGGLLVCGVCGANMTASKGTIRASGWCPSTYGCTLRRKSRGCTNKYISDLNVAPFMFALMSGILKYRDKASAGMSEKALEERLLKILSFSGVKHIENVSGLIGMYQSGITGFEYEQKPEYTGASKSETLLSDHRKAEASLNRLQSIYLNGNISESDYIAEREKITGTLTDIEKKMTAIHDEEAKLSDEAFVEQASYFLMIDQLLNFRKSDDAKIIVETIEPSVLKSFMRMVVENITVTNSLVTNVLFKSGLSLSFSYE